MRQTLYPKRIVDCAGVENAQALLLRQAPQIDMLEPQLAAFHAGSHVILDFGKEMRGGIRVLVQRSDLSPVRIRFGESVAECCGELGAGEAFAGIADERPISDLARRQNATNDHALRDVSLVLPNWSDTPLGDTGFRFVRLDFSGEYTLKSVLCANTILSHRAKYTYRGDRELERIFSVAKRTVDLCAGSGYIWDGIKRDRMLWVGDLAPQVLALTTLYGRTAEVERSIDFARLHAPLPEWMNYQPTYSMWWIISLKDYLDRTGAVEFAQSQMDYLEGLVTQLAQSVDEQGRLLPFPYFLDWQHADTPEVPEGAQAICILAAKAACSLLKQLGRDPSAAQALLARLLLHPPCPKTKVGVALKYLATGTLSDEETDILLSGGVAGMSTFMSYYILKAVHAFSPDTAQSMLREYYGGMLKLGATTFWEDFEPEQLGGTPIDRLPQAGKPDCHGDFGRHCYIGFRRSLCHGWSAGVIAYIQEYLDIS